MPKIEKALSFKGRETEFATAAEHLVCADIIMKGWSASMVGPTMPYDIIADVNRRLIRIQVKATGWPKKVPHRPGSAKTYMFHCRRNGFGQKRIVGNDEFDLFACVAMDTQTIAYMNVNDKVLQTIHLRVAGSPKEHKNTKWGNIDQHPFETAFSNMGVAP